MQIDFEANKTASRYNDLKASLYCVDDKTFPKLKGKAAELRHFGPALLEAFTAFMDEASHQHKAVKLMLVLCQKLENILDECVDCYRMPVVTATEFEKCAWGIAQLNTSLANFCHPQHIILFNHTVKFHYLLHIGLLSRYTNPRDGLVLCR